MKITYSKPQTVRGIKTVEARVDGRLWELRLDSVAGWFAVYFEGGEPVQVLPDVRIFDLRDAKRWFEGMIKEGNVE
jgi:hypothetical protein